LVHSSSELRVFRHLWSRSDALCSSIMYGYSYLPYAKIWARLGVHSSPTRSRRKSLIPEGTPLDFRLPHGKIGIILRRNPWAVGWSLTGRYILGVLYRENRPKSEYWATSMLCSSATVRRREKLTDLRSFLALGLQRGVNSISLQCIP